MGDGWDPESRHVGSKPIATGSFWRTFVKSKWVMNWIDYGYDLVWNLISLSPKELVNSDSSFEHYEFVTKVISDMVKAGATSVIPPGVRSSVVSPLGVVLKSHSDKLRYIVIMIYVNEHLAKQIFKFEGLSDVAVMANKGYYYISYDLNSNYSHVALLSPRLYLVVSCVVTGRGFMINIVVSRSDYVRLYGCSLKSSES